MWGSSARTPRGSEGPGLFPVFIPQMGATVCAPVLGSHRFHVLDAPCVELGPPRVIQSRTGIRTKNRSNRPVVGSLPLGLSTSCTYFQLWKLECQGGLDSHLGELGPSLGSLTRPPSSHRTERERERARGKQSMPRCQVTLIDFPGALTLLARRPERVR